MYPFSCLSARSWPQAPCVPWWRAQKSEFKILNCKFLQTLIFYKINRKLKGLLLLLAHSCRGALQVGQGVVHINKA